MREQGKGAGTLLLAGCPAEGNHEDSDDRAWVERRWRAEQLQRKGEVVGHGYSFVIGCSLFGALHGQFRCGRHTGVAGGEHGWIETGTTVVPATADDRKSLLRPRAADDGDPRLRAHH